jgi:hypothetical protein
MEYTHFSSQKDPGYWLTEKVLEFKGRKILYLLTEIKEEFVLGCDQSVVYPSQSRTGIIKGYVNKWQYKKSEDGSSISELEPIDEDIKKEVIELIKSRHGISSVHFG